MVDLFRRLATPGTAACIAALLAALGIEADWAEGPIWEHAVEAIAALIALAGLVFGLR